MRTLILLSVAALAVGCDRDGSNNGNTHQPDGTPTILVGLDQTEQCANFTVESCPNDVMGAATTYFAGDFNISGGNVSGFEYWYWYPNEALADQSDDWERNAPCWLTWEAFGTVVEDDVCNGCLYELHIDLSFNRSESHNCPNDLMNVEGQEYPGLVYQIRAGTEGGNSIRVYFPPSFSASNATDGTATNSRLQFTTPGRCAPVGSVTCETR